MRRLLPGLLLLASAAGAVTAPVSSGATPATDSATLAGEAAYGTGIMVNAGYFFKDTMFYSGGRGGPYVNAGKMFPLPLGLAVWAGAGVLSARGSFENTLPDGGRYWTTFTMDLAYADLGLATPWTPFPVALVVYSQSTDLKDEARTGALAGRRLAGSDRSVGIGVNVHLLFEWFLTAKRGRHRGPALVLGYEGFIDLSPHLIATTDAGGGRAEHPAWKPFRGESLRGGVEWEF